jgi:hypothetical protein
MTDTEFFKKKNKIVKRVTGVVLIPDDQIVETGMEQVELEIGKFDLNALGGGICPYCIYFYKDWCKCCECPMALAGNKCNNDNNSSWRKAKSRWVKKATTTEEDIQELRELCEQYNKELK